MIMLRRHIPGFSLECLPSPVLFLLLLAVSLRVSAEPELKIVTETFPPYNFEVEGEARGMSTEVVQAMLRNAGLEAKIEFLPWARAYRLAQIEPNTLIYSIARIPEREHLFSWIGTVAPYWTSFYKLKANTELEINSLDDARPHRVGVSRADVIKTFLENRGFEQLEVASADNLAIRMLFFSRMDLLAFDESAIPIEAEKAGLDITMIERVFRIEALSSELYVAIHPDSDPALVRKLRNGLKEVKESGEYKTIRSRYFPD